MPTKYISKINKGGVDIFLKDSEARDSIKDSMNQAAMLMLANFAGLPTTINSAEYKYVLTDLESRILFGKK